MDPDEARLSALLRGPVPEPLEPGTVARLTRGRRGSAVAAVAAPLTAALVVAGAATVFGIRSLGSGHGTVARVRPPMSVTAPAQSSSTVADPPSPAAGCPATRRFPVGRGAAIDYIDFVVLHGRTYDLPFSTRSRPRVDPGSLTRQVGAVDCTISDVVSDNRYVVRGRFTDGDASFLPVGTPLLAIRGYPPSCRIGAVVEGRVSVYFAIQPNARILTYRPCASPPRR